MARNRERGPTLDRLFGVREYFGFCLDVLEESEDGPVLVSRVTEVAGRRTAVYDLFETPPNLLEKFLRLPEGGAEKVVSFATKYGLLGLCFDHGCPVPHRGVIDEECRYAGRERVAHWLGLAQAFKAALLIAAKLHRNELASTEDWIPLVGAERIDKDRGFLTRVIRDGEAGEAWFKRTVDWDWEMIGEHLNDWVALSDLRLRLNFPPIEVGIVGMGLHGVLVRELVFTAARVEGFAVCAGCGTLVTPRGRQPVRGRQSWCGSPACRRVANRLAKRRQRAREAPN